MEIFETFGLDWTLVLAQVVNFLIIYIILKKFLYKPLLKVIKKREDLVKESIDKADESRKALEKAEQEEKKIISAAQKTASEIVSDAKSQSEDIVKKAEDKAKKQTDKMLQDAKEQIELETVQAQAKLQKYVTQLSMGILKQSVNKVFSEKEQRDILERAMKELQKQPN